MVWNKWYETNGMKQAEVEKQKKCPSENKSHVKNWIEYKK